jgi:hypothetical protein
MPRKGRLIALVALLAVLAAVAFYQWGGAAAPRGASGTTVASAGASGRRSPAPATSAVPAVRLDALQAAQSQPAPASGDRNPFQFQAKLPPPAPPMPVRPGANGSPPGVDAAGNPIPAAPPPPPIPFKFIGIVQAPSRKLAVLSDTSTKDVFYGREGDIIDGRYRILRIGVESVEMAYLDGRGRQTIRLTGS